MKAFTHTLFIIYFIVSVLSFIAWMGGSDGAGAVMLVTQFFMWPVIILWAVVSFVLENWD